MWFNVRQVSPGGERHATWLELFFDLVFASAVAEVGAGLGRAYDLAAMLALGLPFALIWWAWAGHTFFATRFDPDDGAQRLLTGGQVFLVAVMAANVEADLGGRDIAGFAAAYGVMRLLLAAQYHRVPDPGSRRLTRRYAAGTAIAAVFWLGSALLPPPLRYGVWLLALVVEILVPLVAERDGRGAPAHPGHLPERFGLFTLIMLGESVAGLMAGMKQQHAWTPTAAGAALLSLSLTFLLWWLYFDHLRAAAPRTAGSPSRSRLTLWLVAHLPLSLGVVVVAVGLRRLTGTGGAMTGLQQASVFGLGALVVTLALAAIARADWGSESGPGPERLSPSAASEP
ncbi:MAG: low temperature requirement protein A [Gemmatimonadales bacterium]